MKADFTYIFDGLLYTVFPETQEAIDSYNLSGGLPKLLPMEFDVFRAHARRAGYSVRKAKKIKQSDSDILRSLGL